MTDETENLPGGLSDDLARLRQAPAPPDALEARVLRAARSAGLIRVSLRRQRLERIAASVILVLAGAAGGRVILPPAAPPEGAAQSSRYLLLLAGDVEPAADGSSRAEEYGAWAGRLAARGLRVDGEELAGQFDVVSPKGTSFPELASMGGFFLIEAESDAAAAALARTCPHVKYGGSVIVRRVLRTSER